MLLSQSSEQKIFNTIIYFKMVYKYVFA